MAGTLVTHPRGNLLIDTPPDLRTQLLREQITLVNATLFTHDHADHVFGLDDLRVFPHYLGRPMPIYCETQVEERIRKSFDYAFSEEAKNYAGGVPQRFGRHVEVPQERPRWRWYHTLAGQNRLGAIAVRTHRLPARRPDNHAAQLALHRRGA